MSIDYSGTIVKFFTKHPADNYTRKWRRTKKQSIPDTIKIDMTQGISQVDLLMGDTYMQRNIGALNCDESTHCTYLERIHKVHCKNQLDKLFYLIQSHAIDVKKASNTQHTYLFCVPLVDPMWVLDTRYVCLCKKCLTGSYCSMEQQKINKQIINSITCVSKKPLAYSVEFSLTTDKTNICSNGCKLIYYTTDVSPYWCNKIVIYPTNYYKCKITFINKFEITKKQYTVVSYYGNANISNRHHKNKHHKGKQHKNNTDYIWEETKLITEKLLQDKHTRICQTEKILHICSNEYNTYDEYEEYSTYDEYEEIEHIPNRNNDNPLFDMDTDFPPLCDVDDFVLV